MKKVLYVGIVSIVLSLCTMGVGNATPVLWSVNGHYYEIVDVPNRISWDDAKILAESMSYLGLQGYLATITSMEENLFISFDSGLGNGMVEDKWLGGYQVAGSPEPGGGWQWVTGEAFGYNNWAGGEPNNNPDNENAIIFQHGWTADGKQWNDLTSSWTQSGYVIEYGRTLPPAVPEPATMLLVGLGLVGLAAARRKFQI